MSKDKNSFLRDEDLQKLFDEYGTIDGVAGALGIVSGSEDENCDSTDNEYDGK